MSLKKNIIANFLGQSWSAFMGIAFLPLYIDYMGIEAYGLVGIYVLFQACLTLLDMGMTPTLNREVARYTSGATTSTSIVDLLRSFEIICLVIAILFGLLIWLLSGWLAREWLIVEELSDNVVEEAISVIGIVISLRLVEGIYRGVILGVQKQVAFNSINAVFASLRSVGVIGVLEWWEPTVQAYFLWQGLTSVVAVITFRYFAYRYLAKATIKPKFSCSAISNIRRFATGVAGSAFLALTLTQIDKILLSKLISLEVFAYYTLAGTVVLVITLLVTPIAQACYPRFSSLIVEGDIDELKELYHRSAQLVTVSTIPIALLLIFFGRPILFLWTSDQHLTDQVHPLLAVLSIGTFLNTMMHIPFTMTLAYGWSSYTLWLNLAAVIFIIPAIYFIAPIHGALGTASVLIVLNLGYLLIGIHYLHRKLLLGEKWRWYFKDVIFPIMGAVLMALTLRYFQPSVESFSLQIIWLLLVLFLISLSALINARELVFFLIKDFKNRLAER